MKRMAYGAINRYIIGHRMGQMDLERLQYTKDNQNQLRG